MVEAEVHARANGQDGVGSFERFTTRGGEEERVRWGQAAASRAIEEDGGLDALRQLTQRFGSVTPPDGGTGHDDRALCMLQKFSRFVNEFRIGKDTARGAVVGGFTWIKKRVGIDKIIEYVHGHF